MDDEVDELALPASADVHAAVRTGKTFWMRAWLYRVHRIRFGDHKL